VEASASHSSPVSTLSSQPGRRPLPALAMTLPGAAYPVLAHVAALDGRPWLIAASIGLLVFVGLLPGLRNGRALAWIALLGAAAGLQAALASGKAMSLLMLPPVLLNGFMAWVFGRTLQHGETPLIERVARAIRGPDNPVNDAVVAYTRRVTQAWTVLFVVLAAVNLVLALLARPGGLLHAAGIEPGLSVPLAAWSTFANLVTYLLIGALFVIEYVVRGRLFPEQPYHGPADFVRRLARVGHLFRPAAQDGRRPEHGVGNAGDPPA
jgi:uncharacterized membrane protein